MVEKYDQAFKLMLIGDSGVGKSQILVRFTNDAFSSVFTPTIGIDFGVKTVDIDGKKIKLTIWDTAGRKKFGTVVSSYYRGSMGIMLVYNVADEESFDNIRNWMKDIQNLASADVEIMLLGNKCDLSDARVISKERGQLLADEYGIKFMEVSAKTSSNVEEAFLTLANAIKEKMEKPDITKDDTTSQQ